MRDIEKPTALDVARMAMRTGLAEPAMRLGAKATIMGSRAAMMNPGLSAQLMRRALPDMPWQGRDDMPWRQGRQMPWQTRRRMPWQAGPMMGWNRRRRSPWQNPRGLMPWMAAAGVAMPWMREQRKRMRTLWEDGWELPIRPQRRSRRAKGWQLILAAAAGAFVAYMLDPEQGNRRRNVAAQRAANFARRGARELGKASRYMGNTLAGKREMLMRGGRSNELLDDATLAHKVESVLFRDPHMPKGNINVNSEHGVVVLRGEVQTPEEIREIERRVRDIEGVQEVRSMLHSEHAAT
jgi:BON domain